MFVERRTGADNIYDISPSKIKLGDDISLSSIFQMLSSGLTFQAQQLTVSEIKIQMDKNGDGAVSDREIAKWIRCNMTEEGKDYLPTLLRPKAIFNFAASIALRNNDRSGDFNKFTDVLTPLGGDCQLKTILDIGCALSLNDDGGINV